MIREPIYRLAKSNYQPSSLGGYIKNVANTSDTEAPFLDLHQSISNGFVSAKIYDKRDDFDLI